MQPLGNELTHTAPKQPSNGVVTFEFTYTAPSAPGIDTLFANGNSVNFDSQESGDQWNFAPNKIINVMSPTSIEDENIVSSYKLEQNYPNPFNPSTNIRYTVAPPNLPKGEALVQLKVYDILGNELATLVNKEQPAGNYEVQFNAKDLSSGVYLYTLKVGSFTSTKKLILLR